MRIVLAQASIALALSAFACDHDWGVVSGGGGAPGATSTSSVSAMGGGGGNDPSLSCAPGQILCGAACADTTIDFKHCGSCDNRCAQGEYCQESACRCAEGPIQTIDATVLPTNLQGTTIGQEDFYALSCAGNAAPDQAFRFTAPSAGNYLFESFGLGADTSIGLYLADNCQEIACNEDPSAFDAAVTATLAAGQSVHVVVSGTGGAQGEFGLFASRVEGAECAPIDIGSTAPQTLMGTTADAVDVLTPGCGVSGTPDVVYAFTAPSDAIYDFDTNGSSFDTVLELRDGECNGAALDCNGGDPGGTGSSWVRTHLVAGQTVFVVVDGQNGARGPFTLNVSAAAPATCERVALESRTTLTATGSTLGRPDVVSPSCGPVRGRELVYSFTPPSDGTYTIDTRGSTFDTVLYVLDGDCAAPELACNDDEASGLLQSEVTLPLSAGREVSIVVDGFEAAAGDFTLHIHN